MRDLRDVLVDLQKMVDMPCKPNWERPKEGTIFDEDKSVKWNKEEVIRLREKYDTEVRELNTKKNKERDNIEKEIYRIIKSEIKGITIEDAEHIYQYAFSEKHAYGYNDVINFVEELIDLISPIVKKVVK